MPTADTPGHVHVIAGDLTRLACDAWLLPTDGSFLISASFAEAAGVSPDTRLATMNWAGRRVAPATEFDGYQQEEHQPAIWLGDVGRWQAPAEWYADVIEPFVAAALAAVESPLGNRPLLAVNVLGTGQGGMASDKGEIHEALLPALIQAARDHPAKHIGWIDPALAAVLTHQANLDPEDADALTLTAAGIPAAA